MDWWLTQMGRIPIGPVSTELLLKGIRAGEVPNDVLVCEVGGRQWRKVTDIAPFGTAFAERLQRQKREGVIRLAELALEPELLAHCLPELWHRETLALLSGGSRCRRNADVEQPSESEGRPRLAATELPVQSRSKRREGPAQPGAHRFVGDTMNARDVSRHHIAEESE